MPPTSSPPGFHKKPADPLDTLESLLGELPGHLRRQAFTHSSWVDGRAESYERLAFVGDVVLSLAVSTHIYPRFPEDGAGGLTKLRAQAVSRQACAQVARDMGVPDRLRAAAPEGTGKSADVLLDSDRILASLCESVIGACYVAFGFDRVAPAVVRAFHDEIERALEHPVDFKSVLQERLARRARVVGYRIESEEGPPHERSFVAVAEVDGVEIGRGEGKTKKSAEQEAALRALETEDGD
ncbi:MAG: ribonuclease III domain-containing protein [Thermoleophilaceae bacterium]